MNEGNVWAGRSLAAMLGGVLWRANPLLGALLGLLVWIFALEKRRASEADPASTPDAADQAPAAPSPADPYVVLGVSPQASDTQVEQAWRRAMAEAHPDRHVRSDARTRAAAERRTRELNAAWRQIKSRRRAR